jgi:sterol desaturase/sphingolipid hydroxylase (fatty acid hydroxylase superfamily)
MVFMLGSLLGAYEWILRRAALVTFPAGSPWPWVIAFVWIDVAYYWWHRLSHEVNFMWAVHAVHHQSEDYNLAVALRQAVLSSVTSFPFYAPMALLGVPTLTYGTMLALSTLYQFWIHTELIRKLGPLELVLNTPSAHRVHHAVNPRYLDRNYAATLIVWDRLFGTYAEERERPVYGVTKPIRSFNPVWAQVEAWVALARRSRRLTGLDRLRVWWRSPAWDPGGPPPPSEAELLARPKHDTPVSGALGAYALVQLAPLIAATFLMLLWQLTAPTATLAVMALLVFWSLLALGGLLDRRPWAVPVELGRLAALAVAIVAVAPGPHPLLVGAAAVAGAAGLAGWLLAATRTPAVAAGLEVTPCAPPPSRVSSS